MIVSICYPSTKTLLILGASLSLVGVYNLNTGIPAPPSRPDKWAKDPRAIAYDTGYEPNKVTPKSYLSVYRSILMLLTCFSILAVDFDIFSRDLAKTEDFGNSLMDLGVGSFVFSAGIVGARPFLSQDDNKRHRRISVFTHALRGLKTAFPLLALGMVRFVMVESVDYQKHVSEYGVHWNFYLTLGLLPVFVPICMKYSPQPRILGYAIICVLSIDVVDIWTRILDIWG